MGKDVLYEAMKVAAKRRKIKASPQHDLYKKDEPYFYCAFYDFDFFDSYEKETGLATIILDIAVKYCRFDELRWGIIQPGNGLKFTDKVRANSIAACKASFPRKKVRFKYDGSENGLSQLCGDILDYLENRVSAFCEQPYRRSDYERLLDYTIAMQHGVKWTEETAAYGLLPEERHGK